MLRVVIVSNECESFIALCSKRVLKKFKYVLEIITEHQIVHKAVVEKLVNSNFYELKIKADNQIRVILFTLDNEDFNQSTKIVLLNGFLKKDNKDYVKAIQTAKKILEQYKNEED